MWGDGSVRVEGEMIVRNFLYKSLDIGFFGGGF